MATRSGYSSGSSPCALCNTTIRLSGGTRFKNPYVLASFVILCISLAIVFGCLIASTYYSRWRAAKGAGRAGRWTYFLAAFSTLVTFALLIADRALVERSAVVKGSYYIIYVFITAFIYASPILILAVFARFAEDSIATGARGFNIFKNISLLLLTLLAAAIVSLTITDTAYALSNARAYQIYERYSVPVGLAFNVVYLIAVIVFGSFFARNARVYSSAAYRGGMFAVFTLLLIVILFLVAISSITVWEQYGIITIGSMSALTRAHQYVAVAEIMINFFYALILVLFLQVANSGTKMVNLGYDGRRKNAQQAGNISYA